MTVLERPQETADKRKPGRSAVCACLECGKPFQRGKPEQEFCGRVCVRAWNNRRMRQGAELFDLVMIVRFDREKATSNKVWRAINRLASQFRDADKARRGGRRSWRRLASIRQSKPLLWID